MYEARSTAYLGGRTLLLHPTREILCRVGWLNIILRTSRYSNTESFYLIYTENPSVLRDRSPLITPSKIHALSDRGVQERDTRRSIHVYHWVPWLVQSTRYRVFMSLSNPNLINREMFRPISVVPASQRRQTLLSYHCRRVFRAIPCPTYGRCQRRHWNRFTKGKDVLFSLVFGTTRPVQGFRTFTRSNQREEISVSNSMDILFPLIGP